MILLRAVLASLALIASPLTAAAQDWPNRTIHFIVPFPAGGSTDLSARVLLGVVSAGLLGGFVGIRRTNADLPKPLALAGFVVAVFSAGFLAWWAALRQSQMATWEPTPRPEVQT